jgi:hypothetical protein
MAHPLAGSGATTATAPPEPDPLFAVEPVTEPPGHPLRQRLRHLVLAAMPDPLYLRYKFRQNLGRPLDLRRPRLFCEKLQWLKLHDCTPLHTRCVDKLAVRDHVAELIGPEFLVPLLLATADPDELTPARIEASAFAAKATHDCGSTVLCRDRERFDWAAARAWFHRRLVYRHYLKARERAYRDIEPKILVEEMLQPGENESLKDYKFYCFHGKVHFVMVVEDRSTEPTRTLYDLSWRRLPFKRRGYPTAPADQSPPRSLGAMVAAAEALAAPFRFCRIDFYEIGGRPLFGEVTFYPDGGFSMFEPLAYEYDIGELLTLPGV